MTDNQTTGLKAADLEGSKRFLLSMVEAEIGRTGSETESFLVRSGLLRDILRQSLTARATPKPDADVRERAERLYARLAIIETDSNPAKRTERAMALLTAALQHTNSEVLIVDDLKILLQRQEQCSDAEAALEELNDGIRGLIETLKGSASA